MAPNPPSYPTLIRQRTLLAMLDAAGGRLSRTSAVKWCFLLRHEMPSGGGSSFYEFVPYRYCPFSFGLYQEAGTLVRNAYGREPDRTMWAITSAGTGAARGLADDIQADVVKISRGFGRDDPESVREYVYRRHPWYTVNSQIEQRMERHHAASHHPHTVGRLTPRSMPTSQATSPDSSPQRKATISAL